MRTFMPYPDFAKCAQCFTMKRLTKQRHDVMQILYMLSGRTHPTIHDRFMYNSPPKKVWCQIPFWLIKYGEAMCDEYESRTGKRDPLRDRLQNRREYFEGHGGYDREQPRPFFLESEAMQKSHRAILARQDAAHYEKFGFVRCPDDEKVFYWPVEEAQGQYEPNAINEERRRERDRRRRDEERDRDEREDRDEYNDPFLDENDDFPEPQPAYTRDECDCEACQLERRYREQRQPQAVPQAAPITPSWIVPAEPQVAENREFQRWMENAEFAEYERRLQRQQEAQIAEAISPEPYSFQVQAEDRQTRQARPSEYFYRGALDRWGGWDSINTPGS
jgi:hypothetical protein